jgi:pyrimidine operon attenuation protein/uracil phosphoribosyltransferase
VATRKLIGSDDIHAALTHLAETILARHPSPARLIVLGIANGGIAVARRLADRLGAKRVGTIDISFYRDDIGHKPIPKEFTPTVVPGDVNGATVILVDDVLFSGRTVKAALDELFEHGRPAKVELAVLIDRGGRKLPVAADYVGRTIDAGPDERVVVRLNCDAPAEDLIRIEPAKP